MVTKDNIMTQEKIAVAMSGGVDSAVAALLLKNEGHSLLGLTMRLWSEQEILEDAENPLPDENAKDAASIASLLDFPHKTVGFGTRFRACVIQNFLEEYEAGRTPNPCVVCNRAIKFGALYERAMAEGCTSLATGHYARLEQSASGEMLLKKAADTGKDQSYFLWSLPKEILPHIHFPLGNYTKPEIRTIAAEHGFVSAHRSDSQDICFIQNGDYVSFMERYSQKNFPEGDFVTPDGRVLGRHSGIIRYTIGQRKGLGIAVGSPIFVGSKNVQNNTVTLCSNRELYHKHLTAKQINLFVSDLPTSPLRLEAKIRYRHAPAVATVEQIDGDRLSVTFDEPQRAIAPGQSLVLYDGDTVIGGGIIE